jgi:predicted dehydrogenase
VLLNPDQIRVGIVGYGKMGRLRRRSIDDNPNSILVAVCDPAVARDTNLSPPRVDSLHQLLNADLDALVVCVPNDQAARSVIYGLEHGMHVFCEKPPGRNLDEVAAVMRVAKSTPELKLMYGFNHRWHASVQKALEVADSGRLGRLISINGVYGKPTPSKDWRTNRTRSGGGILLDQGIHMLDLMRLFAGEFSVVASQVFATDPEIQVEDNALALMRTESGVVANLHSSATLQHHCFRLELSFQSGALHLDGLLTQSGNYAPERLTVIAEKSTSHSFSVDNSFDKELGAFFDAVHNDKEVVCGTPEDAFLSMELVYRIYCACPVWQERFALTATPREIWT